MGASAPGGWEGEFERWLEPFLVRLRRQAQRRWAAVYLKGLLLPGERKSVEPLAARVAPGDAEQLHHLIGGSPWATAPLEAVLAREADRLVGGPGAVLVVDDTALPKQGRHSVGVARQYCGCLGKRANCQVLVSLTLARGEVPVPIRLRLFLPEGWTADTERCARAGVPEEHRRALAKTDIALGEIDRVMAAGARFGRVVADAGYGISAAFRLGLSARSLLWAVGIPKVQNVYSTGVELLWPKTATGRPRKHPVPSEEPVPAEQALAGVAGRRIGWRRGTKGPLAAEFAALRVRPAEGDQLRNGWHLPGDEVWLVGGPARGVLPGTGLDDLTHDQVVDLVPADAGLVERTPDGDGPELSGGQVLEGAEEATDRGAGPRDENRSGHTSTLARGGTMGP